MKLYLRTKSRKKGRNNVKLLEDRILKDGKIFDRDGNELERQEGNKASLDYVFNHFNG